jgi:hypothetical protein
MKKKRFSVEQIVVVSKQVEVGTLDVGGPLASLPFGSLAAHNFIKIRPPAIELGGSRASGFLFRFLPELQRT